MSVIRIATRKSALALWQAEFVKAELLKHHPELTVELVPMTTKGDKILDTPLAKVGGKGLFVKELETAMLEGRADIAVHSMKDVPVEFPVGLGLSVICEREDPRDAFVSNKFDSLDELPQGAIVGTSSLRRECQLRSIRPDLDIRSLRGNVNTRLQKLDDGEYDAIILASAGLIRLGMKERIKAHIEAETMLPAVGQGAVGIECRLDDQQTLALLAPLNHQTTQYRVVAERAMNTRLEGGCQVPIGSYAEIEWVEDRGDTVEQIHLRGLVGSSDGTSILRAEAKGHVSEAENLGIAVAEKLLAQGADKILEEVYADTN